MNYNPMKDKWNVHELHGMLVQEEVRLKNQGTHSINFVSIKELERNMLKEIEAP